MSESPTLLVLGGTEFVGRAVVAAALSRGWDVTVFNRGRNDAPAGVHQLVGDRTAPDGLSALTEGAWDVVVDTWSADPWVVRDAANLLADRVGHHVLVSSRSVYAFPTPPGADETAPLVDASPDASDVDYAAAKRGGELAVARAFGDRHTFVRAGLILGPHENIGRLPWWLSRIHRGGDVLAPGPADLPLQYVDARDLAAWALDAGARGLSGPYDVVSRPGHATMGELLEAAVEVTDGDAHLRWVDPEPILAAGVEPWTDLPVWVPPGDLHDSLHGSDTSRAAAAGLTCRPVTHTVADTWAWMQSLGGPVPQRPDRPALGLDPDVEASLLAAAVE